MDNYILRFAPCDGGWEQNNDCPECFQNYGEEVLYAAPLDRWRLPLDTTKTYNLINMDTGVDEGVISSTNPNGYNTWQVQISGIESTSLIRVARSCDGVVDCTEVVRRSDFGTDQEFVQAIGTLLIVEQDYDFFTTPEVSSGVFEVTANWTAQDCRCNAILTTSDLSSMDINCGGCDIEGESCCLDATVISEGGRCNETIYLNVINIQFVDLCVEVLQQPLCIENDPYLTLFFPNILGCFYISDNLGNCSQKIEIQKWCSTMYPLCFANNNNQDVMIVRLPLTFQKPSLQSDRTLTRATNLTIKKLFQRTEVSWEFKTSMLEFDTHQDIYDFLSRQNVAIQRIWNQRGLITKNFILDEEYKVDQPEFTNPYNLFQGSCTLIERDITQQVTNC